MPAVPIVAAGIGAGASILGQKKADKAAKKRQESAQEYNERMMRDRFQMQQAENRRAREYQEQQIAAERQRMNDFYGRKYAADSRRFNNFLTMKAKWQNALSRMIQNPGKENPMYGKMKTDLERTTKSQVSALSDALRRQGITGGKQVKLQTEATSRMGSALAEAMSSLQQQAIEKKMMLDNTIPEVPYLGYSPMGMATYTPAMIPEIASMNPNTVATPNVGSGIGEALGRAVGTLSSAPGSDSVSAQMAAPDIYSQDYSEGPFLGVGAPSSTSPYAGSMDLAGSLSTPGVAPDYTLGADQFIADSPWLSSDVNISF